MDQNRFENEGCRIGVQGSINNNGTINFNNHDVSSENKKLKILRSLYKSMDKNRKDRNPDPIPGTCKWFTAHQRFQNWRSGASSTILWVSADPGCGKSVLAKYLVDSILMNTESSSTCYFFFKDDFEGQNSVLAALCCILYQLFLAKRALLSASILEQFEIAGEEFTSSFDDLWRALLTAAKDRHAGEIICVLDALDECRSDERKRFMQQLNKLYSTRTRSDFNLKFLLTSRPYRDIVNGFQPLKFQGSSFIHLSGENKEEAEEIAEEIGIFIEARVNDIGVKLGLTFEERNVLLVKCKEIPNRTYLWVHLTLELIEDDINISKNRIIEITSRLPKTLDEAYNKILSKSDNPDTKKLLHIVVAAARPLTLSEMSLALALEDNHQSYKSLDLPPEKRARKYVRDLCGLFVTIVESRIYLLHQTAKEFLVRNEQSLPDRVHQDIPWKHSLQLRDSHRILANICIRQLLLEEIVSWPAPEDMATLGYVKNFVFLDYSAKYWTVHFRESGLDLDGQAVPQVLGLCHPDSKIFWIWFRIYWTSTNADFPRNFTPLMVASYFGLAAVVKHLLGSNDSIVDLNAEDDMYRRTALSWAAGNGYDTVVKQLLSPGLKHFGWRNIWTWFRGGSAQVDSMDRYGRTALVYAIWKRNVPVIRLLLQAGARSDSKDDVGGTPFSYALCSGDNEVVQQCFNEGIEPGLVERMRRDLLLTAASRGREDVVRLLLEVSTINPNARNRDGQTPLYIAAQHGNKEIAALLLENGADKEGRDNFNQTPLLVAAEHGNKEIVALLLENGTKIEGRGYHNQTPLIAAAGFGSREVVTLLLENGANIEGRCEYGRTPLHRAIRHGNKEVVALLLENGADIEGRDNSKRTPLLVAAEHGNKEIVALLLENGANIEGRDSLNRTPLLEAIWYGCDGVAYLYVGLQCLQDHYRPKPLSAAAAATQQEIVELLLKNGADIEGGDKTSRIPLLHATIFRRKEVVELLLKNGAEIGKQDNKGRTALSLAVDRRYKEIELLIRRTAAQ
ncbi:hypothetical protein TWF694_008197 [Orbilia ellipsospora]|uniref:NACHT domain-containing protein n=1 Tax=Orbilia ellipsospora TaxID=2528407 RepID=A0AAV9XFX0_9PEZI